MAQRYLSMNLLSSRGACDSAIAINLNSDNGVSPRHSWCVGEGVRRAKIVRGQTESLQQAVYAGPLLQNVLY